MRCLVSHPLTSPRSHRRLAGAGRGAGEGLITGLAMGRRGLRALSGNWTESGCGVSAAETCNQLSPRVSCTRSRFVVLVVILVQSTFALVLVES